MKLWRRQWLSCINIHRYFRFKVFFFFFPLLADFLFLTETHRYSADTNRFDLRWRKSARVGTYREKKIDAVRRTGSSVPCASPCQTQVQRPFCRVRASQLTNPLITSIIYKKVCSASIFLISVTIKKFINLKSKTKYTSPKK